MSQQTTDYPIDVKQLSSQHSGSRNFGPLTLTYNLDLTQEQISVTASLAGSSIGTRVIEIKQPYPVNFNGSVGFCKAKVELTMGPTKNRLNYNISIENFGSKIYKGSGIFLEW